MRSKRDADAGKALRQAAKTGDSEAVQALIEAGVPVDHKGGDYEQTALHYAAREGRTATVEVLLTNGIQRRKWNFEVCLYVGPPLCWPCCRTTSHESRFILKLYRSCALLPSPSRPSKKSGANANARNRDMRTPLHWAASNGNASVVRALVAAGADMEAKNADGETPLEVANYWNNPETAPALRHLMVSARDSSVSPHADCTG